MESVTTKSRKKLEMGRAFADLLKSEIQKWIPAGPNEETHDGKHTIGLFLSGGTDSMALGFAAQDLGLEVHVWSFVVRGRRSIDFESAFEASRKFGWIWHPVIINVTGVNQIAADFIKLMRPPFFCQTKTQVETTWPYLYIIDQMRAQRPDVKTVLSGIGGTGLFGTTRRAINRFSTPKEQFDAYRESFFQSPNPASREQLWQLCANSGLLLITPFLTQSVFEFLKPLEWEYLNRPVQKHLTLLGFEERFRDIGRRDHGSPQTISGVDEVFEMLIGSNANANGRLSFAEIVEDYRMDPPAAPTEPPDIEIMRYTL